MTELSEISPQQLREELKRRAESKKHVSKLRSQLRTKSALVRAMDSYVRISAQYDVVAAKLERVSKRLKAAEKLRVLAQKKVNELPVSAEFQADEVVQE